MMKPSPTNEDDIDVQTAHVTCVDRLSDGIVVELEDGRSLIFTDLLLHSMISAAIDVTELPTDD